MMPSASAPTCYQPPIVAAISEIESMKQPTFAHKGLSEYAISKLLFCVWLTGAICGMSISFSVVSSLGARADVGFLLIGILLLLAYIVSLLGQLRRIVPNINVPRIAVFYFLAPVYSFGPAAFVDGIVRAAVGSAFASSVQVDETIFLALWAVFIALWLLISRRTHFAASVRWHLELDSVRFDRHGRLMADEGIEPAEVPSLYVARTRRGAYVRYTRRDTLRAAERAVAHLPPEDFFAPHDGAAHALIGDYLAEPGWHGFVYTFPKKIRADAYPNALRLTAEHQEMLAAYDPDLRIAKDAAIFAIIQDGRIVATCHSAREDYSAVEAEARTLPEYRGRGFSRQVCLAWAHHMRSSQRGAREKTLLFSHATGNEAAAALARGLRLRLLFEEIEYV
jgi:RimJ/RimL family protein N-acetyltransferase